MSCELDTRCYTCQVRSLVCVRDGQRRGLSLLELLAVVTILAVLAAIVVKSFSGADTVARREACYVNKGDIEIQARLWFRDNRSWPANNLIDIGADPQYFPGSLPICPVDGSAYVLGSATHLVIGHTH